MLTEVLKIPSSDLRDKTALKSLLEPAANLIKEGECVAFPTETVYGLGALALETKAIDKIFQAKGRPNDNPLIAHVNSFTDLSRLVEPLGKLEEALIQLFSPGPITYVLKKRNFVPHTLTAGLDTVAVRIPANPIARALIALCDAPIAAPSANLSGMPSPTEARHVLHDLDGKIPLIIDGGPCAVGLESTVLDLSDMHDIKILRPGAVTAERLIRFLESRSDFQPHYSDWRLRLQALVNSEDMLTSPKSPGMKYRHYAPKTKLVVLHGTSLDEKVTIFEKLLEDSPETFRFGLYVSDVLASKLFDKHNERSLNSITLTFEESEDGSVAAQHFFSALRELDDRAVDLIVVESLPHNEVGTAYMNRLEKASGGAYKNLLFVCTGNTCRSPLAEALFNQEAKIKSLPWQAKSAGMAAFEGDAISANAAVALLNTYGIDASAHRSRRLTEDELRGSDLVLTMTGEQARALRSAMPAYTKKIASLAEYLMCEEGLVSSSLLTDVKDPYAGDEKTYQASVEQLAFLIEKLSMSLARKV